MRLPSRSFCSYCLSLLVCTLTVSFGQAQSPKEPVLSSAKQKLLKERAQLLTEAGKLFQEKNYSQGMAKLQQVLAVEKKLYGSLHENVVSRLKLLAKNYELLSQWKSARLALVQLVEIHTNVHGKEHWKTQDAQRAMKDFDYRNQLKPEERQLLRQADQWNTRGLQFTQTGKSTLAIPLIQKTLAIRRKILGEKHPAYINSLTNLAGVYLTQGAYAKALPLFKQTMALNKEVLGEKHPNYAQSLNNLAGLYNSQGEYAQSLPLFKQALALRKETVGENHPDYAQSLSNLAGLYQTLGEYNKALSLLKEARAIIKEVLGENHPHYAISLSNLATLYQTLGEYAKALPLNQQTLALRKKLHGEKHPSYAISLNNLAGLYVTWGEYGKALPLLMKAKNLVKGTLGEKHPRYATTLNNLAMLYQSQGKYDKALILYQQAMALTKEVLGEKHPEYATSLSNLAMLHRERATYDKALSLHHQAMALRKEVLGEKHPDYAASLNNLAALFHNQGEDAQAFPLYQQALKLTKEVLGEKHPRYATSLSNLAGLYEFKGEFDRALVLYQQALTLKKEVLGEKHSSYATSLNNLAGMYLTQGAYAKALPLYQQVLVLRKNVVGEKHPHYVDSLNNLAVVYFSQGAYAKALPLYQQALSLSKELRGEKHPKHADSLNNLALLYYAQEQYPQAEEWYLRGAKVFLASRLRVANEGLKRASHTHERSQLAILVTVLAMNDKPTQAWNWLEQSLGRATLDEVMARNTRTEQEQDQLDELQGIIQQTEARLKKLALQPELSREQQQLQKRWITEQSKNFAKQAELYQKLEEKYGIIEGKSYSLKQIQSALADDAALLTWIDAKKEHWVVLVRSKGAPIFQRMKGSKSDWTKEDSALPTKLYALLKTQRETNPRERETLVRQLRQQRIAPIAKHLNDIEHVILLPSPLMDKIPAELLLPEKKVSHAPSATMYAYLQEREKTKGTRLLALGDPIFNPQQELKEKPLPDGGILIISVVVNSTADKAGLQAEHVLVEYDGTPVNTIDELNKAKAAAQSKREVRIKVWDAGKTFEKPIPTGQLGVILSKLPAKVALQNRRQQHWQLVSRGDNWNALPGTRIEVASIAELMDKEQRQVLLDSSASEQSLHQLASTGKLKEFRYLHFATHGQVNGFLPMESALILSRDGVKANVAQLKANEPYMDGRLTAKEVALHWTLDADLVTLSACNSGLGKYAIGEGYMGFAQSFLIRGSRSVVLSLWTVDDTATALLMKRFYENLIKKKMTKIDALREAKKWLRTLPRSEVSKLAAKMSNGVARGPGRKKLPPLSQVPMSDQAEDSPYAHPYYWSAFILIGDPH